MATPNQEATAAEKLEAFRHEEYALMIRERQIGDKIDELETEKTRNSDRIRILRGVIEGAELQRQAMQPEVDTLRAQLKEALEAALRGEVPELGKTTIVKPPEITVSADTKPEAVKAAVEAAPSTQQEG